MILVYHHNDLDGLASAAVVKYFNTEKTYMRPVNYKNLVPNLEEVSSLDKQYGISNIFIVDYSFTNKTLYQLKDILNAGYPVTWIDHHESSKNILEEAKNLPGKLIPYIDLNNCGAIDVYNYFISGDIPYCLKLVNSWDIWKHDYIDDRAFKLYFDTKSYSDTINIFYNFLEDLGTEYSKCKKCIEKGRILEKYENAIFNSDQKRSFEIDFEGYKCIVINSSMKTSLLFGDLINNYDIAIAYHYNGNIYSYSIYTTKNIDVSKLAEKYNGGGHKKAAAFYSEKFLF